MFSECDILDFLFKKLFLHYLLLRQHRNLFFHMDGHNRCRNDAQMHFLWYNAQFFFNNAWKQVLQGANFTFSTPYFFTKNPIRRICISTYERFEAVEVWPTFWPSFWYTTRDCNLDNKVLGEILILCTPKYAKTSSKSRNTFF